MKIGIVALWWPPHFGGAEMYVYRLACALREQGIAVEAITSSPSLPERDNGDFELLRCGVTHEPLEINAFRRYLAGPEHAAWCDLVVQWAQAHRFSHILCNAPLLRVGFTPATPALIARLRATGALVGVIHHDFGQRALSAILASYTETHDWEQTAQRVAGEQKSKALVRGAQAVYDSYGSPLYYAPAFVLSNSHWANRFIDPLELAPKYVLHPRLPAVSSETKAAGAGAEPTHAPVTVAMINPLPQKGAAQMAQVILQRRDRWSFRVLQGGWGQAFVSFTATIAAAMQGGGQVELLSYVRDMPGFFQAAQVFLFPSRFEGYGLAAVEAMQAGTPVVATDYPAIREAVGEGARLVTYGAADAEWLAAIEEVLAQPALWRARAAQRTLELQAQETTELAGLIAFLRELPPAVPL